MLKISQRSRFDPPTSAGGSSDLVFDMKIVSKRLVHNLVFGVVWNTVLIVSCYMAIDEKIINNLAEAQA